MRVIVCLTVVVVTGVSYGVEIAHAGLGDVVDEAAPAVEDVVTTAEEGEGAQDVQTTVDETVADAKQTVDEATGQATETVGQVNETAGQVAQQVTDTGGNATKAVDQVVNGTPVGKVLDTVEAVVAPVVKEPLPSAPASGSPGSDDVTVAGSGSGIDATSTLSLSPGALSLSERATPATAPGATLASPTRHFGGTPPPLELMVRAPALGTNDGVATASRAVNSSGHRWPFSPSFPVDTAAVAALVAGAAGGALTAALLAAFVLMAPSAGRWLRPGPTLGWPPPAVPSLERPG